MATLFNTKIKDTYQSLLKLEDNTILTTTVKNVTDGLGNASPLYMSTTRIGIGTNAPTTTLDVNGSARINGALTLPNNNTTFLTVGTFTWFADGNNILRLTSGGLNRLNLGTNGTLTTVAYYGEQIGSNTNPEAYSHSIAGNIQVDGVNRNLSSVNKNIFIAQTTGVGSVQNAPILRYFYAVKGGVTGFTSYRGIEIEDLDSYFGTTSGNVMIGTTTNAGYKLDVNGTARFVNNITYNGNLTPLSTSSAYSVGLSSTSTGGRITAYTNNGASPMQYINFGFNNTSLVSSGGFTDPTHNGVGFALTNSLNYSGAGGGTYTSFLLNPTLNFAGNPNAGIYRAIYYNPTLTNLTNATHIAFENTTGNVLLGTTSGNVGIGTSSPTAALDVATSVTASSALARAVNISSTLTAAANNDSLVSLDINPTFTNGAFTGVNNYNIRTRGLLNKMYFQSPTTNQGRHDISFGFGGNGEQVKLIATATGGGGNGDLYISLASGDVAVATTANANALFQTGGNTFYKSFSLDQSALTSGNGLYLAGNQQNGITNGIYFRFSESRVAILSKPSGGNGYADFRIAIVPLGSGSPNNPPQLSDTKFMITQDTTNVLINTTTDAGYKLDVNGSTRVKGTGLTSATTSLLVQNSAGTAALIVRDDRKTLLNGGLEVSDGTYTGFISSGLYNAMGYNTSPQQDVVLRVSFGSGTSVNTLLKLDNTINGAGAGSTTKPLVVLANSSQTANLIELQNSSGVAQSAFTANGNLIIGASSINSSAILQADSTTKGFLPPRMTSTQRNAISSPATGLQVYDTTQNAICEYTGTAWRTISGGKQILNATTGATTIDLSLGNVTDVTLTLSTVITLSNPTVGTYVIKLIQDAIGGKTVSWPFNVLWSGSTPPTLTSTANRTDVITLIYDGVNYYGTYALNF